MNMTDLPLVGPLLDPYEGVRSMSGPMSVLGGLAGFIKAVIGLGARPTAGLFESGSKVLQVPAHPLM
jgi:hypothetical protein